MVLEVIKDHKSNFKYKERNILLLLKNPRMSSPRFLPPLLSYFIFTAPCRLWGDVCFTLWASRDLPLFLG